MTFRGLSQAKFFCSSTSLQSFLLLLSRVSCHSFLPNFSHRQWPYSLTHVGQHWPPMLPESKTFHARYLLFCRNPFIHVLLICIGSLEILFFFNSAKGKVQYFFWHFFLPAFCSLSLYLQMKHCFRLFTSTPTYRNVVWGFLGKQGQLRCIPSCVLGMSVSLILFYIFSHYSSTFYLLHFSVHCQMLWMKAWNTTMQL